MKRLTYSIRGHTGRVRLPNVIVALILWYFERFRGFTRFEFDEGWQNGK